MTFNIFIKCIPNILLVPKHFRPPKRSLIPIHQLFPSTWEPRICFLSLRIYLFWLSHVNKIIRSIVVSGFFHLACSQASSMLQHTPVIHSFLWLSNIPLYRDVSTSLSSCRQLVSIWVVSAFWLL